MAFVRLDNATAVHHVDALADSGDHTKIMGDHDESCVRFANDLAQQLEHLRLNRYVERGGWFVGDDERRVRRERNRNHHALAHATRELMRIVLQALTRLGDTHAIE